MEIREVHAATSKTEPARALTKILTLWLLGFWGWAPFKGSLRDHQGLLGGLLRYQGVQAPKALGSFWAALL